MYDNTLQVAPGIAAYPAAFPGLYTVAGSRKDCNASTPATVTVTSKAAYDITVVSANRFLRRFTGDVTKPGAGLTVTASYYAHGFDDKPKLILDLDNSSGSDVTFTVTPNFYSHDKPETVKVRAHGRWGRGFDAVATSHGWYDVTVTASGDPTWSQRFIGHIETGEDSVTGSF